MAEWSALTVAALKAELKKRSLPLNGLKADLVARLDTDDAESVAETEVPVVQEAEAVPATPEAHGSAQDSLDAPGGEKTVTVESQDVAPAEPIQLSVNDTESDAPLAQAEDSEAPKATETITVPLQSPVNTQNVLDDLENRKKRSRSPPPSATNTPRKRARQTADLPLTNVDGAQSKDGVIVSKADSDWVEKHNGIDTESTGIIVPDIAVATEAPASADSQDVHMAGVNVQDSDIRVEVSQADADWVEKHNSVDEEMINAESKEVAPAGSGAEPGPTIVDSSKQDTSVESVTIDSKQENAADTKIEDVIPSSPSQNRDARFKGLFNGSAQDHSTDRAEDRGRGSIERDQESERLVEPAIHPATSALYIRDFQRPLNPASLREHIAVIAAPPGAEPNGDAILTLFLDPIRTHAFVEFTNISAAARVRSELHNRIWPSEVNRKALWVDFIPSERVQEWIAEEQSSGSGRAAAKKWEVLYEPDMEDVVVAKLQEATSVPAVRRPSAIQPPPQAPFRDMPASPLGPRADIQPRGQAPPLGPRGGYKPLDQNTRSTQATPVLSYQPVSKDLANRRLDSIERATSKRPYVRNGDINRYSFENGDVLIDRGEERFSGIRPPPRGGRGGGPRGGGAFRGRGDRGWRGGRMGGDRYDSYSNGRYPPPRDDGRLAGRDDRYGGYDRRDDRNDTRHPDRRF